MVANDINRPHNRTDYQKPLSDTTIANHSRNIKVFFYFLFQIEREIKTNPTESIQNIKAKRKQRPLLTEEEIRRILRVFDITTFHGYRNSIVTRLLLDTGMRVSECLGLLPERIDFKHKAILIENSKSKQKDMSISHLRWQMT